MIVDAEVLELLYPRVATPLAWAEVTMSRHSGMAMEYVSTAVKRFWGVDRPGSVSGWQWHHARERLCEEDEVFEAAWSTVETFLAWGLL